MSAERPLRGHCQCGRNRYIVQVPKEASEAAQVLFDSTQASCFSQSTPLAAFLRVPLTWYQSTTYAFFPDETPALIHRTYSHPSHQYAQRHFCGFCGTPLAYWSEQPRAEADYIKIALGSLVQEDLNDLEDLGLIPDPDELPSTPKSAAADNEADAQLASHSSAMTWFDDLMEGSAMSTLRRTRVATHTAGGRTKVEWEITEWTEDGDAETDITNSTALGKRKLNDRADSNSPSQQAH